MSLQHCLQCGKQVCTPCLSAAANDNTPQHTPSLTTKSNFELVQPRTVHRIACALASVPVQRRKLRAYFFDVLISYTSLIRTPYGETYYDNDNEVFSDLVDRTFGDDPDDRWLGYAKDCALAVPKQRTQLRIIPRWRLIDVVMRIDGRL